MSPGASSTEEDSFAIFQPQTSPTPNQTLFHFPAQPCSHSQIDHLTKAWSVPCLSSAAPSASSNQSHHSSCGFVAISSGSMCFPNSIAPTCSPVPSTSSTQMSKTCLEVPLSLNHTLSPGMLFRILTATLDVETLLSNFEVSPRKMVEGHWQSCPTNNHCKTMIAKIRLLRSHGSSELRALIKLAKMFINEHALCMWVDDSLQSCRRCPPEEGVYVQQKKRSRDKHG